ncbi:MAG: outer membrane lipoprotein-sorting protein [Myxococcota bacterium]
MSLSDGFAALYPTSVLQQVALTTFDGSGGSLRREMQVVFGEGGRRGDMLIRFTSPSALKGTGVLLLEHSTLYVYLPALRRSRRVSVGQMRDAFFGSDFSYQDLLPKRASDFTLIDRGEAGDCEVFILLPSQSSQLSYSKFDVCVDHSVSRIQWIDVVAGAGKKRLVVSYDEENRRSVSSVRVVADQGRVVSELELLESRSIKAPGVALFGVSNLDRGSARRDRKLVRDVGSPNER